MPFARLPKVPSLQTHPAPDAPDALPSRRPNSSYTQSPVDSNLLRPDSAAAARRRPASTHGDVPSFQGAPAAADDPRPVSLMRPPRSRFSFLQFRSDSHLRASYIEHGARQPNASLPPPDDDDHADAAPAPVIGVTAPPPTESPIESPKKSRSMLRPLFRSKNTPSKEIAGEERLSKSHLSLDRSSGRRNGAWPQGPESEGGASARDSHSQISRDNSSEYRLDGLDMTAADRSRPTTSGSFFKFSRRGKKQKKGGGLFPLPADLEPGRRSNGDVSMSSAQPSPAFLDTASDKPRQSTSAASTNSTPRPVLDRHTSGTSARSLRSASYTNLHGLVRKRSRTSTLKSFPAHPLDDRTSTSTPGPQDSGRNSTASTTLGRNSIAGLRNLTHRLRGPSESTNARTGSNLGQDGTPSVSNANSFALSRETLVVPEKEDGETAGKYYSRLEKDYPKKGIAMLFSKSADQFAHDVLRSLMRTFKYYEEPMDMSLRRFLWEIDLPNEAQQIDRVISAFAERYYECNPHIFDSFDDAYLIAYSLLMLHSDLFNKNNKRKMQKHEYQRNTRGHGIHEEILGYFYDNIHYTEFIAQNLDDEDGEKKPKGPIKSARRVATKVADPEKAKPVSRDPYDAIIDDRRRLDILRPALREVLIFEDPYNYQGSAPRLNLHRLRSAFNAYGVLQIVSARSRPDAFNDPDTTTNPMDAHPGVIDIKVIKIGTLWRKDAKKKKTRSPWQEWGAILTTSQLYFCRNTSWVKGLVSQYEHHQKHGGRGTPCVFNPPLEHFVHEAQLPTTNAVALQDTGYKRHKHAFLVARRGGSLTHRGHEEFYDEILLGDNEQEMNDWIAKINYAATIMTANMHSIPSQRIQSSTASRAEESQAETEADSPDSATAPVADQLPELTSKLVTPAEPSAAVSEPMADVKAATDASASAPAEQSTDEKSSPDSRLSLLRSKVAAMNENLVGAKEKLDDQLKTARHLEILAPFPAKTRTELLSFGARMSLNIRWSRYEYWRSKCQRDILQRELDLGQEGNSSIIAVPETAIPAPKSPTSDSPSGISRLSSKASNFRGGSRPRVPEPKRLSQASFSGSHRNSLIAAGIDQAFATPDDALGRSGSADDGPFKLPPLGLGTSVSSSGLRERYQKNIPSEHRRHSSISTTAVSSTASDVLEPDEEFETPRQSLAGGDRPSEAESEKEKDAPALSSSPHQRPSVRRSLQRSLRDRDTASPSRTRRPRRHKDSQSSVQDEFNADGESLSRRPGSFKLHGKKASVITLGSEWQQVSPEELLKQRRQAQTGLASKEVGKGIDESPELSSIPTFAATRQAEGELGPSRASVDASVEDTSDEDEDGLDEQ